HGLIAMVLIFAGLFAAGAGLGALAGVPSLPGLGLAHSEPGGVDAKPIARSTPTKISIPAINVSAPVAEVGLAPDGAIGVPPLSNNNLVGWYSGGPAPGQLGPAVIVGHVDGPSGKSVFYRLGQLKPGEKVHFDLANHHVALFTIYSVEYYPKGKFPGGRVYGDMSRPGLRLITCGGNYLGGSVGYADNIVVYASMTLRG
ncbi:MAG TPA: class F sortase, partial [Micromonosporaceae bacterium]|nr:class F sortase [Micromonosporaceae bacterium]